jgi:hypothetical protein
MAGINFKLAYGNKDNIATALSSGKIDEGDLVVTTSGELAFVKPDGTVMYIKSRIPVFDTQEEADAYLASDAAYEGEIVSVKNATTGVYVPTVATVTEDGTLVADTPVSETSAESSNSVILF